MLWQQNSCSLTALQNWHGILVKILLPLKTAAKLNSQRDTF